MEVFGDRQEDVVRVLEQSVRQTLELMHATDVGREYHQARQQAPGIVRRESRVRNFLRAEDWHVLKASQRIARYWKVRKEIYGPDRWLLPLTQTGQGVLTSAEVALLRTGFMAPAFSKETGSVVNIIDTSRLPKGAARYQPGILFYLGSICPVETVTLFHVINVGHVPVPSSIHATTNKLLQCLPHKINKVLITKTFQHVEPRQSRFLDYMALGQQRRSQTNFFQQTSQVAWVHGNSLRAVLDQLEQHGLEHESIPLSMGGSYFYHQQFDDWIRRRLSLEQDSIALTTTAPSPVVVANNHTTALALPPLAASKNGQDGMLYHSPLVSAATTTTLKQSPVVVRSSVVAASAVHNDNSVTTKNNHNNVLVCREPGESREVFERRRSLVYGQRSYRKKRREMEDLQLREERLSQANTALQADNRRLEHLLGQARFLIALQTEGSSDGGDAVPNLSLFEP